MNVCTQSLHTWKLSNSVLDVAVITGLYLATYNVGQAVGNTISGVLWNQVLPKTLEADVGSDAAAEAIYGDPFTFVTDNPVGTPVRDAAILAYQHVQRLMCITGICLSVALIAFALVLRDPVLGDEQSLPNAENEADRRDLWSCVSNNTHVGG